VTLYPVTFFAGGMFIKWYFIWMSQMAKGRPIDYCQVQADVQRKN